MADIAAWVVAIASFIGAATSYLNYVEERRKRLSIESKEREEEKYRRDLESIVTSLEKRLMSLPTTMPETTLPQSSSDISQAGSPSLTLENILEKLEKHHQRATYGAVARLLGTGPNILMSGRPKGPRYSWVVNKETAEPTGYTEEQKHKNLRERGNIIRSSQDLEPWLRSPK